MTGQIYKKRSEVMGDIGPGKKEQKNQAQGFKFRGIDGVYSALSGVLSAIGLLIIPNVQKIEMIERVSKDGGAKFHAILTIDYSIVSAADGSTHIASIISEAMDSSDKSINKAMSMAYKYLAFQMFCIPLEGEPDADTDTHSLKSTTKVNIKSEGQSSPRIINYEEIVSLEELIAKAGTDKNLILEYFSVKELSDLNIDQLEITITRLHEKIALIADSSPTGQKPAKPEKLRGTKK